MTDTPSSPLSLPAQMGAQMRRAGDEMRCWVDVHDELCSHGQVRGAVLVMMVDVGAGWAAAAEAGPDWTFTVDIGIRRHPTRTDRFEGVPRVLRAGRTISVDLPIADADGNRSASGVSTFVRLPAQNGEPAPPYPDGIETHWPRAGAPLDQLLDADVTADGLAVGLRPELLNPAGILQGGVAALLAELAAQRTLEAATGVHLVVTSFDVRYVTMGRVGPIEAVAEPVGAHAAIVRLFDRGAGDALVTHNLIGFAEV